jgi:hypothetical protein
MKREITAVTNRKTCLENRYYIYSGGSRHLTLAGGVNFFWEGVKIFSNRTQGKFSVPLEKTKIFHD